MQTIRTDLPVPTDTLSQLALYSSMDVLTLFEIKAGLSALMDKNRWQTYEFEMELQSPLLAMSLVGIPVDIEARREMVSQFTLVKEQCERYQLYLHSTPYCGFNAYHSCIVPQQHFIESCRHATDHRTQRV